MDRSLSLAEAARLSNGAKGQKLAAVSLRAAAERGALKARKDGRNWKVKESDLRAYLKSRPAWWQPAKR